GALHPARRRRRCRKRCGRPAPLEVARAWTDQREASRGGRHVSVHGPAEQATRRLGQGVLSERPVQLAKNGAAPLLERLDAELEAGTIDEAMWYADLAAVITPRYLAGDNPRAQSGRTGDDASWTRARGLIADAVDRPGTFLDVGCASGYLMECMARWARWAPLEPYGLDIAPELAALARQRLPAWADRIFAGNAIDWSPPHRFD